MRAATGGQGPGISLPPQCSALSIFIHLELLPALPTCAALGGRERDRSGRQVLISVQILSPESTA